MVKHIVCFKLKGNGPERKMVARKFADALLNLPAEIEPLVSMEVGLNENPAEEWDLVLTAIVEKMEDVEVYAKHPAHLAAASIIADWKEARACVDYEV